MGNGRDRHSCAVLTGGVLKCWGSSENGQLGYGDLTNRGDGPSEMGSALLGVNLGTSLAAVALSASYSHTCAQLNDGSVKCWGYNFSGQLGVGGVLNRGDEPGEMGDNLDRVSLGAGRTVIAIAAGWDHTCAVLDNFRVKCWGANDVGQLGLGHTTTSPVWGSQLGTMGDLLPYVELGAGFEAVAIVAGDRHTCVISSVATVKCWGLNNNGQLGLGDTNDRGDEPSDMDSNLPEVNLGEGRTALAITAGKDHNCVLLDDGSAKCWGSNFNGQLGYGDMDHRGDASSDMGDALPAIDFGSDTSGRPLKAVAIDAGEAFTCAILNNGWVKCWGDNSYGQLGVPNVDALGNDDGEMGNSLDRIAFGGLTAIALAVGTSHAIVVLKDGSVKSWGYNFPGQLGLGDTNNRGDELGEMGNDLPVVSLAGVPAYLCQLGSYAWTNGCAQCPGGTRGLAAAALEQDCVDCPAGYFSAAGSLLCTQCAAGAYSSAKAATCALCPAGRYSIVNGATDSSTCMGCPPGMYSNEVGASSIDTCKPIPPQEARYYVSQPMDDKLALRVDDEADDSTYFFVDQLGRARINTSVFDEAEETLVVGGTVRLRGGVYLGDDATEESTVQKQLARRVEHGSSQSGMLLQQGKLELTSGVDGCSFDHSYYCTTVSLSSPVLQGTQTVILTVKLVNSAAPPAQPPNAWVSEFDVLEGDDDGDDAIIRGFSIQAAAPAVTIGSVAAEVHWMIIGVAA